MQDTRNAANTARETEHQWLADLADGQDVWCTFAQRPARTADGFCQFCGNTNHVAISQASEV
jgi:hypothetical protein